MKYPLERPARVLALALLSASPAFSQEFQTPSGNIFCAFEAIEGHALPELRCDMKSHVAQAEALRPADCQLEWGGAFTLGTTGPAARLCRGDTVADPSYPQLGYGSTITAHGITCAIAEAALTCTNAEGSGFSLSRRVQRLF
ncbi:MAG: hypothetical protein Q4G25_11375 [Paracoccus sp. (in: a-proteobacteria)]|nr:hypothetical protein [Paracoccus sp. (in: a-proteobacteria)]